MIITIFEILVVFLLALLVLTSRTSTTVYVPVDVWKDIRGALYEIRNELRKLNKRLEIENGKRD